MKNLTYIKSLLAILLIAGLFSAEVTAQEQQQRPRRPMMGSIAPLLGMSLSSDRKFAQTPIRKLGKSDRSV